MSERPKADVARGYFRSKNQSERRLAIAGVLTSAVLAVTTITACKSSEESSVTPIPSPTPESTQVLTPTPQETPIVYEQPYTSIPQVPSEDRGSLESIMDYWKARRLEGNRFKLVENGDYEMDVIGLAGIPENTPGPGSTTVYVKAESVDAAFGTRNRFCEEFLEAGGPNAVGIIINFNIIVPNAGTDPFSEIGFTIQQKEEFLTPTTCEATS